MSQAAKANEPSMEEILASIRRIIADDEPPKPAAAKVAVVPPAPQPAPAPAAPPAAAKADDGPKSQDDIDALLADFDAMQAAEPEPEPTAPAAAPVVVPMPSPVAAKPEKAPEPDILELSKDDAVVEAVGMIKPVSRRADIEFLDVAEPARAPASEALGPADALLSSQAHAAVGAAFGSLANTILSNNARTIEDLVKDMLRPMLKTWLDDNLPQLVERLVRAEIERVSRGGR